MSKKYNAKKKKEDVENYRKSLQGKETIKK